MLLIYKYQSPWEEPENEPFQEEGCNDGESNGLRCHGFTFLCNSATPRSIWLEYKIPRNSVPLIGDLDKRYVTFWRNRTIGKRYLCRSLICKAINFGLAKDFTVLIFLKLLQDHRKSFGLDISVFLKSLPVELNYLIN